MAEVVFGAGSAVAARRQVSLQRHSASCIPHALWSRIRGKARPDLRTLTLAFHGKSDSWAFTVSVGIGFTTIPIPVWGSAAVGLVFNL